MNLLKWLSQPRSARKDGITPPGEVAGFSLPAHVVGWSQRAELNRRPTDYELQIGVFRKVLKTGWFLLSALLSASFKHSIDSTNSMNSALFENFYHNFIIVAFILKQRSNRTLYKFAWELGRCFSSSRNVFWPYKRCGRSAPESFYFLDWESDFLLLSFRGPKSLPRD